MPHNAPLPVALATIDVGTPIPAIPRSAGGIPYGSLRLLVRLHAHPIGLVSLPGEEHGVAAAAIISAIEAELGDKLRSHLHADGLDSSQLPRLLHASGTEQIGSPLRLRCWHGIPHPSPKVSVVIATKGRQAELRTCLEAILASHYDNFEIVLVENGSPAPEVEPFLAREGISDERIVHIFVPQAGASRARNIGCEKATGEIVAFTDDDTLVDPYWLTAMVRRLAITPEADCVLGLVLPSSLTTPAQVWFEEWGGFSRGFEARTFDRQRKPGYPLLYPYTAGVAGSGNNVAFRREAITSVGGWSNRLGPGTPTRAGEDLDLFVSMLVSGHKLTYEPAAVILHEHRRTYEELRLQLFNYGIGFTALLTKWILSSPRHALAVMRLLPSGLKVALHPQSTKNENKSDSFPADLSRDELRGFLLGPLAYLRSALVHRLGH